MLQFTFGYGVGGEYPMAAGSAAERAEAKGRASARKRGREVCLPVSHLASCLSLCLFCSLSQSLVRISRNVCGPSPHLCMLLVSTLDHAVS